MAVPKKQGRRDVTPRVCKTEALRTYLLTEKELATLQYTTKPNPYGASKAPMKLYVKAEVVALAHGKHGGPEALEAALEAREKALAAKRARAALAAASRQAKEPEGDFQGGQAAKRARRADGDASASSDDEPSPSSAHHPLVDHGSPSGIIESSPQPLEATQVAPTHTHRDSWGHLGLGPLITERIRAVKPSPSRSDGSFVLYWMKAAIRGHENPALDVARAHAAHLGLPLLVAAFVLVSEPDAFLNARRVKFLLEGLRDAQRELRDQQQGDLHVFIEGRNLPLGGGWAALVRLAARAAMVVTEDVPVKPDVVWVEQALPAALPDGTPLLAVDAGCVVPMRLTRTAYERAGPFRSATSALRRVRTAQMYAVQTPTQHARQPACTWCAPRDVLTDAADAGSSGSNRTDAACQESLDLCAFNLDDIAALAASLPGIDVCVPGVTHMVGGSIAGYARWSAWLAAGGLRRYAYTRNDPMNRAGTSRLSPYLHWGMVSPFRVAREAGGVSQKFLDELLTWREVAWHWCFHRWRLVYGQGGPLAALPAWARATLATHAADARPGLKSDAQLEEGSTGDAVWDAMQRQLTRTGELHNNCRMTWGKAFLGWTANPDAALRTALRLNHKYALDGCDPASYGGVLWCFGLFDGPKRSGTTPITGSLCVKPTGAYRRFNPEKFQTLQP